MSARQVFAWLAGSVLVVVAALRWRVGVDYWNYDRLYPKYESVAWSDLSLLGEPGIRVLAKLGGWVRDDSAGMFALAAVITVGLNVRTIYRSTNLFALGLLIYILSTVWQATFNGLRQQLAVAILFAGHRYIIERRLHAYIGIVLIAILFHLSASVGLLFYAIPRSRLGFSRALLLMSSGMIALFAYDAIGAVFEWVKQADFSEATYFAEQINPLRLAMAGAPLVAYSLFTEKRRMTPSEFFYVNMLFVGLASLIAGMGSAYIARFYQYFAIYLPVALPAILKTRDRQLQHAIFPLALGAYVAFWYLETATESALSNFRWILQR